MAVEFQDLLSPMAFPMEATQPGPLVLPEPGWPELSIPGTIQVTWASCACAMST